MNKSNPTGQIPSGDQATPASCDERGIRDVIEARRLAWNAQDLAAYGALLAPDVELTSATGKTAAGREEVLRLYVEQRRGVYRDASLPSTVVQSIGLPADGLATAQAAFVLVGVRAGDGTALPPIEGTNAYTLVRRCGKWLISSIRGTPSSPIQS